MLVRQIEESCKVEDANRGYRVRSGASSTTSVPSKSKKPSRASGFGVPTRVALKLPVLIVHSITDLILVSARGARGLLTCPRYKVRALPVRPGTMFRTYWIRWQLEPENSVLLARKFQHEKTLRSAEIEFDIARAHARIFGRVGVPIAWHCVAVCIELWLNVGETLDGLPRRGFHFEFQQRCRPIDV